jgi:hypothetical protein
MNANQTRRQSDRADPRTPICRHLADALVAQVSHEHVAALVEGHAIWPVEAGVGSDPVGITAIGAADTVPARKR